MVSVTVNSSAMLRTEKLKLSLWPLQASSRLGVLENVSGASTNTAPSVNR